MAQHCLLVEALVRALAPETGASALLFSLLHDAPEYVIGDMISPFKAVIGGHYKAVEARLLEAIHIRFGLAAQAPAEAIALIKAADREAAYFEATALAGFAVPEAQKLFGAPKLALSGIEDYLSPMRPAEAQERYLARFAELDGAAAERAR